MGAGEPQPHAGVIAAERCEVARAGEAYYLNSSWCIVPGGSSSVSREMVEILVLAAIAGFVVARLYSVLGRRTGAEPPATRARPAPVEAGAGVTGAPPIPQPSPAQAPAGPLADVLRVDPSFDAGHFVGGARAAYEMIVGAFAAGDRETLRRLLTPRVFASYDKAITDRQAAGGQGPELVRLKSAEVIDGSVAGDLVRVSVRFEAELAEGAAGIRETRERWTFERDVRSADPNWQLSGVAQA